MIGYDEAVRLIASAARPMLTEIVPIGQAHGRVLGRAIRAQLPSPRADVSSMDGYAVRSADFGELPATLTVVGHAYPGAPFAGALAPGEAVRIFTGAPLPAQADRVVIQENTRRNEASIVVEEAGGSHIRRAGSDFAAGDTMLGAGTLLRPRALVAAAAADVAAVEVYRKPRLGLLATGDELADPGSARLQPFAVPDSLSFGVAALAADWGAEAVGCTRLPDNFKVMQARASAVLAEDVDVIVVTGGASVGERDFARAMFGDALELIFSKVAMKPGKPVWFGRAGPKFVMGLPGNPSSAMVTARLLLVPLLVAMSGRRQEEALQWRRMRLSKEVGPVGDRETFARAFEQDGRAVLISNQDSGAQRPLLRADLLVRLPAGAEHLAADTTVDALDF